MAHDFKFLVPRFCLHASSENIHGQKMVKKYGLPDEFQPWDEELLFKALTHDKKARGRIIKTVIVPEIGTAKINEVTFEEMKDYLKK